MLYTKDLEDLIEMYEPLHMEKAEMIMLPINDNMNPLKISNLVTKNNF